MNVPRASCGVYGCRSLPLQYDDAVIGHVQPLIAVEMPPAVGMLVLALHLERRPGRVQALDVTAVRQLQIGRRLPTAPPAEVGHHDVVVRGTARKDQYLIAGVLDRER